VIPRLVVFGASGDLAGRYLLAALAALHAHGRLPASFSLLGAATKDCDDEAFRRFAAERLKRHAPDYLSSSRDALLGALDYCQVDVSDAASVARALGTAGSRGDTDPVVVYFALPQSVFPAAVSAVAEAGLPAGSRVALEKPFGEDLEGAVELNALLGLVAGAAGGRAIFRRPCAGNGDRAEPDRAAPRRPCPGRCLD
jgi:glucose-6-phosphate 1-dehydrogenase